MLRSEAVILGILSKLSRPVLRTKFVKLVYLADNCRAEQLGEPLTDFTYHWDQFGPNAVDDGIVSTLLVLVTKSLVDMTVIETSRGYLGYRYRTAVDPATLPLSSDDWVFISGVVDRYGSCSLPEVKNAAYATPPMQDIRQFDELELRRDPEIAHRQERVLSNERLQKQVAESLRLREQGEEGIDLDELKVLLAK